MTIDKKKLLKAYDQICQEIEDLDAKILIYQRAQDGIRALLEIKELGGEGDKAQLKDTYPHKRAKPISIKPAIIAVLKQIEIEWFSVRDVLDKIYELFDVDKSRRHSIYTNVGEYLRNLVNCDEAERKDWGKGKGKGFRYRLKNIEKIQKKT